MRVAHAEDEIQRYVEQYDMARFLIPPMRDALRLYRFPAYTNIYIQGDEQHTLYFLVEGQLQCSHYHQSGKLAVFAVSVPFALIGDIEVFTHDDLRSNVITTRPTTMLGIPIDVVRRHGQADPRFLHFLIDQLREKLLRTNDLQMNLSLPLIVRLAVYLLAQPAGANGTIDLPPKEAFASLMGATPRHLNRVLKELTETGHIHLDYPRVTISDRGGLAALDE